ncbi:hypothetical protein Cadr_000011069 [Camelus dromedarius]|uniref:Transmembrane protein n=1 Tax=Camelus dromedarius TaxID=9838 RepID=A0A5N4DPU0_CAMDR|nr:hypothetical protein Cadr_000011069 [Camelus dromedarius]
MRQRHTAPSVTKPPGESREETSHAVSFTFNVMVMGVVVMVTVLVVVMMVMIVTVDCVNGDSNDGGDSGVVVVVVIRTATVVAKCFLSFTEFNPCYDTSMS